MRSPNQILGAWLDRPQVTNRDALVVGVLSALVFLALGYGIRALLAALDLIDFGGAIPVWTAAIAGGALLGVGLLLGARKGGKTDELQARISDLEARTVQLGAYEVYAEHIRDALADLRRHISGELPAFSLRDFIESGLFVPAQRLLVRTGSRGDIRFSILHPDGDDFVMRGEGGLFPALGHSLEGRQKFRLPIADSFSMLAFMRGKVFASGKLSDDSRFEPHPRATRPYESIISVPLWKQGNVDGVFNVVSTAENAFSPVERTYVAVLGSVIDVARAAADRFVSEDPAAAG
jgi:hypothetical protein